MMGSEGVCEKEEMCEINGSRFDYSHSDEHQSYTICCEVKLLHTRTPMDVPVSATEVMQLLI